MKHTALRAILLLAALACLAHTARTQEESAMAREGRRMQRWMERPGPVKNEELKRELLQMLKDDQAVRAFQMEGRRPTEAESDVMRERDEADTKRLNEILDKYGFPGVKLVGLDATRAFIIMLVHSPSVELQKRALPHVERAVRRKEIPPDDFAMLTDDVLANEHKLQLYGTNFDFVGDKLVIQPSQDPARLDERRRRIGLPAMREYARWLAELTKKTVDESSLPPAKPRRK
ncbi:MAG TPA: DUF6624 domain-containing protein [Pyrinomonadaceae bacterium]|jgi:hypothetical protein|nr:DUF6624 domain-containing protein [Pyrinomonadaceae bacterium]